MRIAIIIAAMLFSVSAHAQVTSATYRFATHTNAPFNASSDSAWIGSPTGSWAMNAATYSASNGYRFNAAGSYANWGAMLPMTSGHFSAWVNLPNKAGDRYAFSQERSGNTAGDAGLYYSAFWTSFVFYIQDGATYKTTPSNDPPTGVWFNVQAKWGPSGMAYWYGTNGQEGLTLVGTNAYTGGIGTSGGGQNLVLGNIWVGQSDSASNLYVDDVHIWITGTELTSAERGYLLSNRNYTAAGGGSTNPTPTPITLWLGK